MKLERIEDEFGAHLQAADEQGAARQGKERNQQNEGAGRWSHQANQAHRAAGRSPIQLHRGLRAGRAKPAEMSGLDGCG